MKFQVSIFRLWAVILKEFVQMKRDRLTFGMIIGIPLIQLILFGFAINFDPKRLPTIIISADESVFTREITTALQNSNYFEVLPEITNEKQADKMLATGQAQFVIYIPQNFSEKLIRGHNPQVLVEVDATDPSATSFAISVIQNLNQTLNKQYVGQLEYLSEKPPAVEFVVQPKYNPERITQYNIVPALLGVVLNMTMVLITSLAIARERERGTMESLLAMPFRPSEVMIGKVVPYILVGYIQVTIILLASYYIFKVPIKGSLILLYFVSLLFIAANLTVGLLFSTIAKNQLQAMQLAFFYFLPSILLSGFMFPFRGMPDWAQAISNLLPLTHFIPIVRGILLKGNSWLDILPNMQALFIFTAVILFVGIRRYRQTLD